MPERKTINLAAALTDKKAEVLSGFDRGQHYREMFHLDDRDKDADQYLVVVPHEVAAVNLSFFLSMFGQSILNLGQERFYEKYEFEGRAAVKKTVDQGVIRALKSA